MAPRAADYDLRDRARSRDLFAELEPDLVIHLAARVGGIGANQARPADLYLDNLLMGTYVIDEARLREHAEDRRGRHDLLVPEVHAGARSSEDSLWQGYPEETNAPYGIAKLAQLVQLQANRAQYGQNAIYLMPTNLYGPGDKFHPAVSHVIPALIKKCVDAVDAGADHIEVWGTGSASREFLYVDDAAEGILLAAEHYDGADPVNLGADREMPIRELVELIVELIGFEGEVRWDTTKPDGQPRRCVDAVTGRGARSGSRPPPTSTRACARTIDWYLGQPRRGRGPRPLSALERSAPAQPGSMARKYSAVRVERPRAASIVRLPAEQVAGQGDVGPALGRVVDRQRLEHDLRRRAGDLEHELGQLEHRELAGVADVDRPGVVGRRAGRGSPRTSSST